MWPFVRYPYRRRCIVVLKPALKPEQSFRGILWAKRNGFLVLKGAELIGPKLERTPVDGELAIPDGNIDYIQILP